MRAPEAIAFLLQVVVAMAAAFGTLWLPMSIQPLWPLHVCQCVPHSQWTGKAPEEYAAADLFEDAAE